MHVGERGERPEFGHVARAREDGVALRLEDGGERMPDAAGAAVGYEDGFGGGHCGAFGERGLG